MAEKIIGLRLRMTGTSDAVTELDALNNHLEMSTKFLKQIEEQAKAFRKLTQENNRLNKSLKETEDRLKKIRNGQGSSGNASGRAAEEEKLAAAQKRTNKQLKTNLNSMADLRRELRRNIGEGVKDYDSLTRRIAKMKAAQDQANESIRNQATAIKESQFAPGSYRRMNAELVRLRKTYKDLSEEAREGFAGRQMLARIGMLDKGVKGIDAKMGLFQRNVGNYSSAWKGVATRLGLIAGPAGLAIAVVKGVELISKGVKAAINLNLQYSDSFASVQKTTDLTAKEVNQLSNELKKLDTRTSLDELLDISRIGGQLGIAQNDLLSFTEGIDKLNVALGDELGGSVEDIAASFGKLNDVFGVEGDLGVAGGINAIGSAVNELGKTGTAQAEFLVDFTSRLGGIAPAAKISVQEVLGLAAAFDEGGQSAEVSSTALIQILGLIGKDVPKFAEIAGKDIEEFNSILERSGNEALLAVLEGAGKTQGGLASLGKTLQEFGVSGTRVSQVLGFMVNNVDLVRSRQETANQAFREGTSLQAEFNVVNETAAAEWEKLGNNLREIFVSETIMRGIRAVGAALNDMVEGMINAAPYIATFFNSLINPAKELPRLLLTDTAPGFQKFTDTLLIGIDHLSGYNLGLTKLVAKMNEARSANRELNEANEKFNDLQARRVQELADQIKAENEAREKAQAARAEALRAEKQEAEEAKKAREDAMKAAMEHFRVEQRIAKLRASLIVDEYERRKELLRIQLESDLKAVTGNEGQKAEQVKLLNEKFTADLLKIDEERAKALRDAAKERDTKERQEEFNRRMQALKAEFEAEKLERQRLLSEQVGGVATEEGLNPADRDAQISQLREMARATELEKLRKFYEDQAAIIEENGGNTIELQKQIAEQEIAISDAKTQKILDNEKREAAQRQQVLSLSLGLMGEFVSGISGLLSKDEKNREKYGAALKALAIAEIAINLSRELSSIAAYAAANIPANAATFGASGSATVSLQSALAIARAAFATGQVIAQSFEFGGAIGGDGGEAAGSGSVHSSSQPGASVPAGTGTVLGPNHADNGVVASVQGNLVELEGGEMLWRNGGETYAINKRAARKFGHVIRKDKANQSVWLPQRKALASAINSFQGWGVPIMREGGTLSDFSLNNSPVSAPTTSQTINRSGSGDISDFAERIEAQSQNVINLITATNDRIDRLVVVSDPIEIVQNALESGEVTITIN